MSAGRAIRWAEAHAAAIRLVALLDDACERIQIAGSIRRRKGEVHDIELVAIPRREQVPADGLWGDGELVERDWLEARIHQLVDEGLLDRRPVRVERRDGTVDLQERDGRRYKALAFDGLPVDLFITDAEGFGCILALRTGPRDFNQRLVTECQRWFRRVEGSRVMHLGRVIPTPDERAFFRALGVPWIEPEARTAAALRFDPEILREAAS